MSDTTELIRSVDSLVESMSVTSNKDTKSTSNSVTSSNSVGMIDQKNVIESDIEVKSTQSSKYSNDDVNN